MTEDVIQSLINGVAVTVGLFVLWSFVGGMRHLPASTRLNWALVAGAVSTVVAFVVRLFV